MNICYDTNSNTTFNVEEHARLNVEEHANPFKKIFSK
jgi:hypothetical protein